MRQKTFMQTILSFRHASSGDFDAVFDLYMDKMANPFLTYDPMEKSEFRNIFHELTESETFFVAEIDGEVAGCYRLVQKTHRQSNTIYLGGFTVKSTMKGKGIGTMILEHIKAEAKKKGIIRIELTVDLNNDPAIHLYNKAGFETEGRVRKSYKLSATNEYYDEYLMGLIL